MRVDNIEELAEAAGREALTARGQFAHAITLDLIARAGEESSVRAYRELMTAAGSWFSKGLQADERAESARIAELTKLATQKSEEQDLSVRLVRDG